MPALFYQKNGLITNNMHHFLACALSSVMLQTWQHLVVFLLGCFKSIEQSFESTRMIVCGTLLFAEGYVLMNPSHVVCDWDSNSCSSIGRIKVIVIKISISLQEKGDNLFGCH